jgi:hypothetical protein
MLRSPDAGLFAVHYGRRLVVDAPVPSARLTAIFSKLSIAATQTQPQTLQAEESTMRLEDSTSVRFSSKRIVLVLSVALLGSAVAMLTMDGTSWAAGEAAGKLEATVFTFDGQDFVRTKTTLRTADGKPALNTKLDHDNPAYQALIKKRSYSGEVTLFGRKYDANYAPMSGDDGRLTGALFVAEAK